MDSKLNKLTKEGDLKASSSFKYLLKIYDVVEKEGKIDKEVCGSLELGEDKEWVSLDVDSSGKYIVVSGYENMDRVMTRYREKDAKDGKASEKLSKIKNCLEIYRISTRTK